MYLNEFFNRNNINNIFPSIYWYWNEFLHIILTSMMPHLNHPVKFGNSACSKWNAATSQPFAMHLGDKVLSLSPPRSRVSLSLSLSQRDSRHISLTSIMPQSNSAALPIKMPVYLASRQAAMLRLLLQGCVAATVLRHCACHTKRFWHFN